MKSIIAIIGFLFITVLSNAQTLDTTYATQGYLDRNAYLKELKPFKSPVVFLGNSITEGGGCWNELFGNPNIVNRGISGDNCWGVYARLDDVLAMNPKKIILLIGINDISKSLPVSVIASKYEQIVKKIVTHKPKVKLYVESVLPFNEQKLKYERLRGKSDSVNVLNASIQKIAKKYNIEYIDINSEFSEEHNKLFTDFTNDGLHLNYKGYLHWRKVFEKKKISVN